jgi:integrase
MGSIVETTDGKFRAFVQRTGHPKRSKTWPTKTEARKWLRAVETKIDAGEDTPTLAKDTVEALVRRYIKEECAAPDAKWNKLRLEKFLKQARALAKKPAARASHEDFEHWVEARKKSVKEQTALRELNVVSGVFTHAMKKWKVKLPRHPTRGMDKPKKGKPRTRRPNSEELKALYECRGGANHYTLKWYVLWMFELGIETGMRVGEMVLIKPADLHLDEYWLHLPMTKNGDVRSVPLSPRAVEIIKLAMQRPDADLKGPFPLKKGSLDTVWRKTCKGLGIVGLHFHDSRHEACTRLAKIYDVLDLAKIIGHRDLKSLMIYYNPTPTELAKKMRRPEIRLSGDEK